MPFQTTMIGNGIKAICLCFVISFIALQGCNCDKSGAISGGNGGDTTITLQAELEKAKRDIDKLNDDVRKLRKENEKLVGERQKTTSR